MSKSVVSRDVNEFASETTANIKMCAIENCTMQENSQSNHIGLLYHR